MGVSCRERVHAAYNPVSKKRRHLIQFADRSQRESTHWESDSDNVHSNPDVEPFGSELQEWHLAHTELYEAEIRHRHSVPLVRGLELAENTPVPHINDEHLPTSVFAAW